MGMMLGLDFRWVCADLRVISEERGFMMRRGGLLSGGMMFAGSCLI